MKIFCSQNYFVIILMILQISFSNQVDNSICSNRGNREKNKDECSCMQGYLTFPKESVKKCNYEMKSEKTAVFLSFFGGIFGADMFYLGYTFRGFAKFLFPLIILTLSLLYKNKIPNEKMMYLSIIFPIILLILTWVYDILRISSGNYLDANNIPLIK